jgi:hypothetical protein
MVLLVPNGTFLTDYLRLTQGSLFYSSRNRFRSILRLLTFKRTVTGIYQKSGNYTVSQIITVLLSLRRPPG